jgi:hypothetical protein
MEGTSVGQSEDRGPRPHPVDDRLDPRQEAAEHRFDPVPRALRDVADLGLCLLGSVLRVL